MAIRQISTFIPNQEGALADIAEIFYKSGIDLRAITVYDTTEYCIMRCIVDDPDRSVVLLKAEGVVAKVSEVLAIEPKDEPGSLAKTFKLLADNLINVEYTYAFFARKEGVQYFVMKVSNVKKAEEILSASGVKVV